MVTKTAPPSTSSAGSAPQPGSIPATPAVQRFDLPPPAPGTSSSHPLVLQIEKTPDPDGLQIFTAITTCVLTALAGLIAWRQWRTSHDTLRFSLFQKRFEIYDATRIFIGDIVMSGNTSKEGTAKFLTATLGTRWLFNEKLASYMQELYDQAQLLEAKRLEIEDEDHDVERGKLRVQATNLVNYFVDQQKALNDRFKSHMPTIGA
ncbi:hypothetical protein PV762_02310 [Mitsuaria sp. CC2]|uniref:hypothetical protein n=1 Tax=Mitsuaria sp. CC2 TaxID=3029186 RepID=UPI003B8C7516